MVLNVASGNYVGNGALNRVLNSVDGIPTCSVYHMMMISELNGSHWIMHRNNLGFGVIPSAGPSGDEVFNTLNYFTWSPSYGVITIGVSNPGYGANYPGSMYHWTLLYV